MILHSEASLLTYAMDIHRKFTDIIFKGQGVIQLIKHLGLVLNREVQLISQFLRPVQLTQQYIRALDVIHSLVFDFYGCSVCNYLCCTSHNL